MFRRQKLHLSPLLSNIISFLPMSSQSKKQCCIIFSGGVSAFFLPRCLFQFFPSFISSVLCRLRRLPHPCSASPLPRYFSTMSPWSVRGVYCAWHVLLPWCQCIIITVRVMKCMYSLWRGHAVGQSVMRSVPWGTRVWSVVCSMSSLSWAVHQVWGRRRHVLLSTLCVCCAMGVAMCSVAWTWFTCSCVFALPWRR